jgi:hypothetical protein
MVETDRDDDGELKRKVHRCCEELPLNLGEGRQRSSTPLIEHALPIDAASSISAAFA